MSNLALPNWVAVLILLFGVALFTLFLILLIVHIAKKRKTRSMLAGGTSKPSSSALIWVILIVLLVSACLTTLCGGIVLYRNYFAKAPDIPEISVVPTLGATQTAIAATEMQLAQQLTAVALEITLTARNFNPPRVETTPTSVDTELSNQSPIPTDTPLPTQTDTPVPTVPPSPTPEPTATTSNLTGSQYIDDHSIMDDFSSKALGWPEMDDGRKILKYEDGGYSFQLKAKDDFDVVYLPVMFNPSEIMFDIRGLEGDQNGTFGIFCHFQDPNNYYYVEFDLQTSKYVIAQSLEGEYIPLTAQTDEGQYWHTAEALKGASSTNHISIGCYLGTIFIMANDEIVDEVSIAEPFAQKGKTALFVYVYPFADDNGYKVIFDNLEAFEPMQ